MHQGYQIKQKRGSGRWMKWALRALFLLSLGFTGGVLFLLGFLVPVERWLTDGGLAQGAIDAIMAALVFG